MVVGWSTVCFGLDVIIFGCLPFAYSEPSFADGPAAYPVPVQNTKPLLTVSFTSGDISLMNNYDDLSPTIIRSGLKGTRRSHFFPFLCPVFLVFLMMCAWVIFWGSRFLTWEPSALLLPFPAVTPAGGRAALGWWSFCVWKNVSQYFWGRIFMALL